MQAHLQLHSAVPCWRSGGSVNQILLPLLCSAQPQPSVRERRRLNSVSHAAANDAQSPTEPATVSEVQHAAEAGSEQQGPVVEADVYEQGLEAGGRAGAAIMPFPVPSLVIQPSMLSADAAH